MDEWIVWIIVIVIVVIVIGILFIDDSNKDINKQETKYQEELMQQANDEIGMPEITEFFEKKMLKEIFEMRDDSNLINYLYTYSMEGKYIYVGKSVGFGIPLTTQYTNPEVKSANYSDATALPQADPNGLYSSASSSATWVMLINETTGERGICYFEQEITTSSFKLPKRLCDESSLPSDY